MIYNNDDLELIMENIKDIFYDEICIDRNEDDPSIAEIDEGLFFSKLENYLRGFFKINDINSLKKAINNKKDIEWEELFEHPCLPYSKIYQYIFNRGKGWVLPSIDDFINLSNIEKKKFTNDMYWSCTPYDHENLWAFSFKTNRKVVTNKNLYCHIILKQDK